MAELNVSEIFYSIQGEGSRVGLPCVFVRLHGCGLRCAWCDTPYALDHSSGGTRKSTHEVLSAVGRFKCRFVELTGGEPLEQAECLHLLTRLCDDGYTVALETGGHVDVSGVDPRVFIIMDLKCPGSGMEKKNRWANLEYLKPTDELKFVIRDRTDYEWTREAVRERVLHDVCRELILSPVFGELPHRDLAQWILEDALPVRMQLQLHKYIWDPAARGV